MSKKYKSGKSSNPFVHITKKAKNTKFIDCEFRDHGTGRTFVKDEGSNTKMIGTKFLSYAARAKKKAIWIPILIALLTMSSLPWWWPWKDPEASNSFAVDAPCSIYTNNQRGGENTVNCDTKLPKPKIELQPFEINTPNSFGFDSVYILKIISDYTIPNFPLKIKLPPTVDEMWMTKGWMYTMTEDYSPEYVDGHAVFDIPNASGEYHLVFSNREQVKLAEDDIVY